MKFVFIVTALSAFIALSCTTVINDTFYSVDTFDLVLETRFLDTHFSIWLEWVKCNKTFSVPHDEAKGLFYFDVWADKKSSKVNRAVTSLVDCTLRATGVISDAGLHEEKYMLQIRKLRFNHTGFDINQEPMENKQQIWDTVYNRVKKYPPFCYVAATPTIIKSKGGSYKISNYYARSADWRDNCYDLITSYARAAQACKDEKDPKGDRISTTWLIMKCVMKVNLNSYFRAPFYPLTLNANSEEEANTVTKLIFQS